MQFLLLIVSNFVRMLSFFLLSLVCSFYAFENLSVIVMRGREENDHEVRILFFSYILILNKSNVQIQNSSGAPDEWPDEKKRS